MDKAILALIITSLYFNVGHNPNNTNISNLTALLFLWAIMPGYTSASYVPTIVLERALYCRYCPPSTPSCPEVPIMYWSVHCTAVQVLQVLPPSHPLIPKC